MDIGAGDYNRYGHLIKFSEHIKMDVKEGVNVDVVGSAENIPFPDSTFDGIISTQVFEHLKNPPRVASEIARVLRPGGIFLVTVPQAAELHEEPNDFWRYTKFGIKELFEKHGLVMVEIDQRGGFYAMLAQIQIRYLIDRFSLYKHNFWGRIANKIFSIWGRAMIWLDSIDRSSSNQKHAIGWCAIFRKV